MTEDEARGWIADHFGIAALTRLEQFCALLINENRRQNLISRSSIDAIWCRHVADSAQLLLLAQESGLWIDIGTGGGFPGMIVAILRDQPIMLVEPRRQRADFLADAAARLGLSHVDVRQAKIASIGVVRASVISARAVASLPTLFTDAKNVAKADTVYVFPRGRSGRDELSAIKGSWRGLFHVEQSITNPETVVVVARGVRPA